MALRSRTGIEKFSELWTAKFSPGGSVTQQQGAFVIALKRPSRIR